MTLQLTDREKAIARGEDPEALKQADGGADKEVQEEGVKDDAAATASTGDGEKEEESDDDADKEAAEEAKAESKSEAPAKEEKKQQEEAKGSEEIDLDPKKFQDAGYDEETIKIVNFARKLKDELGELKESVKQVRENESQREHQRLLDEFHEVCDTFEQDLFGRSLDESGDLKDLAKSETENRKKVYEQFVTLYNDAAKKAVKEAKKNNSEPEFPNHRQFIKKAKEQVFAEELRKREKKALQDQVAEQSKKRRPVGSGIPHKAGTPAQGKDRDIDPIKRIANDPRILKFWKESQEANGAD